MNSALFSSGSTSGKSAWFGSRMSCCSSRTEGNMARGTHNQTFVPEATLGNSPFKQNILESDSENTLKETQRSVNEKPWISQFTHLHRPCFHANTSPTTLPEARLRTLATLAAKLRVAASNDALISIRWGLPIPHQSALRELMFMAS